MKGQAVRSILGRHKRLLAAMAILLALVVGVAPQAFAVQPDAVISGFTIQPTGVGIAWGPVGGATQYNVYRWSEDMPATYVLVGSTAGLSMTDTGFDSNTPTHYIVSSVVGGTESNKSVGAMISGDFIKHGWNMIGPGSAASTTEDSAAYGAWANFSYAWLPTPCNFCDDATASLSGTWVPVSQVTQGVGQIVWSSNASVDVRGVLPVADGAKSFSVIMKPGWNLIAPPYNTPTSWVVDITEGHSLLGCPLVSGTYYWWDGQAYKSYLISDDLTLVAGKAYWLFNIDTIDVELLFPGI